MDLVVLEIFLYFDFLSLFTKFLNDPTSPNELILQIISSLKFLSNFNDLTEYYIESGILLKLVDIVKQITPTTPPTIICVTTLKVLDKMIEDSDEILEQLFGLNIHNDLFNIVLPKHPYQTFTLKFSQLTISNYFFSILFTITLKFIKHYHSEKFSLDFAFRLLKFGLDPQLLHHTLDAIKFLFLTRKNCIFKIGKKMFIILATLLYKHDSIPLKIKILRLLNKLMEENYFRSMMNIRKLGDHFLTLFGNSNSSIRILVLKIVSGLLNFDLIQFLIDKKVFFAISKMPCVAIDDDLGEFIKKELKFIMEITSSIATADQIEYFKILRIYQ